MSAHFYPPSPAPGDAGLWLALDTLDHALQQAARRGIARLDAQMLLLQALGRSPHHRAWLLAHASDPLPAPAARRFTQWCERRLAGEPVAYLLGHKEFHGLCLRVDARVLVPRPETETLVDWALQCLAGRSAPTALDLGTGSGAIALAIKSARPDAQVDAVDASAAALAVACLNAQRLGLQLRLRQAHWLQGAAQAQPRGYDLIVSNPPYIASADPHLPALAHEPASALVSGPDGLTDLRCIVNEAPAHLTPGGHLLLEHGHDQAHAVRTLLAQRGFGAIELRRDLAGIARSCGARWPAVK